MCEMGVDHWQTKCLTISERTRFIFNSELLSDVKFIVSASNSESESQCLLCIHYSTSLVSFTGFYTEDEPQNK